MAKNKRTDRRTGDHKKGSSAKKPGPKITSKGKQRSKRVALGIAAGKNLAQKKNNAHFMAALALARGESMDAGLARGALLVTCQLFEEANLPFGDDAKSRSELNACFERAAVLFRSTRSTIKRL
jgi:hypothetical protein